MFSALSVLLNDLITERIGFFNGLAMSSASLARAVAPVGMGALYAHVTALRGSSDHHHGGHNRAIACDAHSMVRHDAELLPPSALRSACARAWPLNYHLPFLMLAVMGLLTAALATMAVARHEGANAARRKSRRRWSLWLRQRLRGQA